MATSRRRRAVVGGAASLALILLLAWIATSVIDRDGQGASGAGFTHRGTFYALSDAEVHRDRLGDVLDSGIAFQDSTTDVRLITGVDADTAVAALLSVPEGESGEVRQAWLLVSPNLELAADPWSEPELSAAVRPHN